MFSKLDVIKSKEENNAIFQISLANRICQYFFNLYIIFIFPIATITFTIQNSSIVKNVLVKIVIVRFGCQS